MLVRDQRGPASRVWPAITVATMRRDDVVIDGLAGHECPVVQGPDQQVGEHGPVGVGGQFAPLDAAIDHVDQRGASRCEQVHAQRGRERGITRALCDQLAGDADVLGVGQSVGDLVEELDGVAGERSRVGDRVLGQLDPYGVDHHVDA